MSAKIYVDQSRIKMQLGGIKGVWCHLYVAQPWLPEEIKELRAFAQELGAKPGWWREHSHIPHIMITANMANMALRSGALLGGADHQRGMVRAMAKEVEICSCCFGLTSVANTRIIQGVPCCLSCINGMMIRGQALMGRAECWAGPPVCLCGGMGMIPVGVDPLDGQPTFWERCEHCNPISEEELAASDI
jgi:hypothetical protein